MIAMIATMTDIVSSGWFVAVWVGTFVIVLALLSWIMKGTR